MNPLQIRGWVFLVGAKLWGFLGWTSSELEPWRQNRYEIHNASLSCISLKCKDHLNFKVVVCEILFMLPKRIWSTVYFKSCLWFLGETVFRLVSSIYIKVILKCIHCESLVFWNLSIVCLVISSSLYWKIMQNGSVDLCLQTSLSISHFFL